MVNADDRDTYLEITHTVYRARARTDREGYVRAVGPRRPVQTYFGQIITDRERSAEPPTRALKLSTYHSHTQDRLDLGANNADATIRVVRSLGVGFGPPGPRRHASSQPTHRPQSRGLERVGFTLRAASRPSPWRGNARELRASSIGPSMAPVKVSGGGPSSGSSRLRPRPCQQA